MILNNATCHLLSTNSRCIKKLTLPEILVHNCFANFRREHIKTSLHLAIDHKHLTLKMPINIVNCKIIKYKHELLNFPCIRNRGSERINHFVALDGELMSYDVVEHGMTKPPTSHCLFFEKYTVLIVEQMQMLMTCSHANRVG